MTKSNDDLVYNQTAKGVDSSDNANTLPIPNMFANRDQSVKADGNKIRMELIPTSALISLGRVLTYGAEKYSPNSWQGVEYDRYIGAILRHLVAFMDNPNGTDSESGLRHIEHVLTNAAFLNDAAAKGRIPTDERP